MEYEFNSSQNELLRDLAQKMRFVSYFLIGVGVLAAIGGIFTLTRGGLGSIIQATISIVTGVWTIKAASSFQKIVDTQGNDIENLLGALGELRKLYSLQYWLLIIASIFIALSVTIGIISGLAAR